MPKPFFTVFSGLISHFSRVTWLKPFKFAELPYLLILMFCWQIGLVQVCNAQEPVSTKPDSIRQETKTSEERFFQSRLESDVGGKPDLTPLYSCQSRALLPPAIVWPKNNQQIFKMNAVLEMSVDKTHVLGGVVVKDGRSKITAEEVILDRSKQLLKASGGVSIESSDALFSADDLFQEQKSGKTHLNDASFYLFSKHANGNAKQVEINAKNEAQLRNVSFTTCPLSDKSWSFNMSKMELNPNDGWGEAWDTVIKLGDTPVFYFPYINFPIDDRRKTGLLAPVFRSNDVNGFDYTQPIYWNIALDMDATFFPRVIQNRGFQLGTEARFRTQKSNSEVYFEWLEKDRLVNQRLNNPLENPNVSTNVESPQRWLARLNHETQFNPRWRFSLNTRRVSDKDYLSDFNSGVESTSQTRLSSQAAFSYRDDIWDVELLTLTYQSLINREDYRYLPSLTINADVLTEFNLQWQLDSEWSAFEHKDLNQIEGSRAHINPSLSYPMIRPWGFITPKIGYQHTQYQQENQLTNETIEISRNLPIASLDAGLHFERNIQLFKQDYTHNLNPRFFYTYIPHKNQQEINLFDTNLNSFRFEQLWRENRFSGLDRIGDANHISIAVANDLIKNKTGQQLFSFNLGRRYYLKESRVGLNADNALDNENSPWLIELNSRISQSFSFSGFIEWNQSSEETNQATSQIKFEPKENYIVNLSHRYRDIIGRHSEEADFSFALPINERWRLLGRWYEDLRLEQTIDALFGVEYESCCWAIRLVAQKYLNTSLDINGQPITIGEQRYSEGFELQFVFKGVGSVGQSGLSDLLKLSIDGYQDPFAR